MEQIETLFAQAIAQKDFSAGQVLLGQGTSRLYLGCFGTPSGSAEESHITSEHLFDIASLSKPIVTVTLVMNAVQAGRLDIDQPVSELLSGFKRPEITPRHLLAHTSGLPDWLPIYEGIDLAAKSASEIRECYLTVLNEVPLLNPLGSQRVYSDLGFMLLGFLLEEQLGAPLDQLFHQQVAQALALNNSVFNPLSCDRSADIIVATKSLWRNKILRGEVHDDNAYALGGAAGHAGLFSNVIDIEKFIHWLWEHWESQWMQQFLGAAVFPKLGWDTPTQPGSQAGQYFSDTSFGHLAFTGCSLWLDPCDRKYIILLTNRVLFANDKTAIKAFRPKIHDHLVTAFALAAP